MARSTKRPRPGKNTGASNAGKSNAGKSNADNLSSCYPTVVGLMRLSIREPGYFNRLCVKAGTTDYNCRRGGRTQKSHCKKVWNYFRTNFGVLKSEVLETFVRCLVDEFATDSSIKRGEIGSYQAQLTLSEDYLKMLVAGEVPLLRDPIIQEKNGVVDRTYFLTVKEAIARFGKGNLVPNAKFVDFASLVKMVAKGEVRVTRHQASGGNPVYAEFWRVGKPSQDVTNATYTVCIKTRTDASGVTKLMQCKVHELQVAEDGSLTMPKSQESLGLSGVIAMIASDGYQMATEDGVIEGKACSYIGKPLSEVLEGHGGLLHLLQTGRVMVRFLEASFP